MESFKKLIKELYAPDLSTEVLTYIFMVAHKMDGSIDAIAGRYGLTRTQFNMLNILSRQFPEPCTLNAIKDRSVMAKSDISRVIGRMEKAGLVDCKLKAVDKRSLQVLISAKGQQLFNEMVKNRDELMKPFDAIAKEEMEQLKLCLTNLLTEIEKQTDPV